MWGGMLNPRWTQDNSNLNKMGQSAADVKMEIPVFVRSLKSSILSSTSLQMDITF